mgnify:CR=1 FL=1|tara:strand:- start:529 stop:1086 length:558 start_codon:yes stop_codon:yes gene_type:complete
MRNIYILNFKLLIFLIFVLNSCGIYKPVDVRDTPINADERIAKNMEEGKGIQIFNKDDFGVGSFSEFNPLWRASLDTLDFMILSSADYGGGIIITDWYSENNDKESIKITVRFHSNEIRADGLDVIIHNKVCEINKNCKVSKVEGKLNDEIKVAILKKAMTYDKKFQERAKKLRKKKRPKNPVKK